MRNPVHGFLGFFSLLLFLSFFPSTVFSHVSKPLEFTIQGSSNVREVPRFLTPKECKDLLVIAKDKGFERPNFDPKHRDCTRLHTVDPDLSAIMMPRMRQYLPEIVIKDGVRWRLNRFTHHWRYVRYQAGGHFSPHFDGAKMLPWHEMTVFTAQFYLNEGFLKGATRFYGDFKPVRKASNEIGYGSIVEFNPQSGPSHIVIPTVGKLLLFDHADNTLHDGEPVGEVTAENPTAEKLKYIMRADVLYTAMKEDIPLLENPTLPPDQRMWCKATAMRAGTRDYAGHTWVCQCGDDKCGHGLDIKSPSDTTRRRLASFAKKAPMKMILVSGKRASGKDFVTDKIQSELEAQGLRVYRGALGAINKRVYAAKHGIDLERLESDRTFKESHRLALVAHHAQMNAENPGWFVSQVFDEAKTSGADVLLLSDLRTREDLEWFKAKSVNDPPTLLRVDAKDAARLSRGWDPDFSKDQLKTEVELDSYEDWTARFDNSDNSASGEKLADEWVRWTVLPRFGIVPSL